MSFNCVHIHTHCTQTHKRSFSITVDFLLVSPSLCIQYFGFVLFATQRLYFYPSIVPRECFLYALNLTLSLSRTFRFSIGFFFDLILSERWRWMHLHTNVWRLFGTQSEPIQCYFEALLGSALFRSPSLFNTHLLNIVWEHLSTSFKIHAKTKWFFCLGFSSIFCFVYLIICALSSQTIMVITVFELENQKKSGELDFHCKSQSFTK